MTAAIVGALILWLVLSPTAAVLLGRMFRDTPQSPPSRVTADTAARRAHLHLVR